MRRQPGRRLPAALAWVLAGAASGAQAHLVETGFGAFYDGVAHVLVTPADQLLVLGLALLAGQRGTQAARWALAALPLAWLAGGVLGAQAAATSLPVLTTLSFGLAGALVAFDARLPATAVAALALAAGALHGWVNGATLPPGTRALGLAGAACAAFRLFAVVAAQASGLRAAWTRIAVRVAGSWLAAAALLMLGWLAR